MKAIVVGAGLAGLASAIRLAVKGYTVEVLEANSYPGGKLTAFEQDGFRFDAGPSLFTMPHLVDELFVLAGENPLDHFRYHKQEEACRYFWEGDKSFTAWSDQDRFADAIEELFPGAGPKVREHLTHSAFLYDKTAKLFMERSLHKPKTYLSVDVLKALGAVYKLDLLRSMHKVNEARFKDPLLVQLFDRFATYNGSNPYQAPGIMNIIPHLEHNLGTFLPEGGMHRITESLVALAQRLGVTIKLNSNVNRIVVKGGRAVGVESEQGFQQASVVVSNMDVVPTYRKLLPDQKAPEKTLAQERSSSALIFYWGMDALFPKLGLHNIFFGNDYSQEFDEIFNQKTAPTDPTVYVNITSKSEAADAPDGGENWFVMVNVPSNQGQDWPAIIPKVRQAVVDKLSLFTGQNIEALIKTEAQLDPVLLEQKTSSYQGALYGAASNDRYAAFLRHPNFSRKLKGLYFCGGSVHPGGGIPLCLLSAKIVGGLVPEVK